MSHTISLPLLTLLLLHTSLLSATSIIPSNHFRQKSCVLRLKDTIRSLNTQYEVVTTKHDIFTFSSNRCTATPIKSHSLPISDIIPATDNEAYYCHYNKSSPHQIVHLRWSDFRVNLETFKESSELQKSCLHNPTRKEAFFSDDGIIYSATVQQNRESFGIISKYDGRSRHRSYVNLEFSVKEFLKIFIYGEFLYVVYKDNHDQGGIVRMCKHRPLSNTYIRQFKYSKLLCLMEDVSYDLIVDVKHISGTLFLLASRHPASLSGRVLCSFNILEVDFNLNNGKFRYVDIQGLYQEAKGSTTVCSDSHEKQDMLHELKSPISSTNLIVQFPGNFSSFDIYAPSSGEELIYFTYGDTVDIWRFKNNGASLIQRLYTGRKVSKLEVFQHKLYITAGRELLIAPALWCEHIQDAYSCYDEDNFYCAWDPKAWKCKDVNFCKSCVARSFYTTFSNDFPNGVSKQEAVGCHLRVIKYSSNFEYTDEYKPLRCAPYRGSYSTELVSWNTTCGGEIVRRCKRGTTLDVGNLVRTCQPNGTWSGTTPICKEVKCNPMKPPRHSVLSTLNRSYGTTVTMRCVNRCYQPQYPLSVTCQQSGHWTAHPLPQCVPRTCPVLALPHHVILNEDGGSDCGDTITYQCKEGYLLSRGNLTRECLDTGSWSGYEPICEVVKCNITADDNVDVLSNSPHPSFQETIRLSCKDGYVTVSGSERRTCLSNGTWSGQPLLCSAPEKRVQAGNSEKSSTMMNKDGENIRFRKKDDILIGFAVTGWFLFLISLCLVLFLMRKRREHLDSPGYAAGYGARLGISDIKHDSPERQVTMTTQLSSRDSNEPIWT